MSDALLPYYSRELSYIRELSGEFARAHPQVAARLGISQHADEASDPHVERMIEAFAYLTARVRRKLDDEFPELVHGLLSVLYPHFVAPIPSMAIVQVKLQRAQAELTGGYTVPAGTEMESARVESVPRGAAECRFRTAYPVTVWPMEVVSARLGALPFSSGIQLPQQASAALFLEMKCFTPEMTFSKLQLPAIRFFLAGEDQHTFGLYELIFNNAVELILKFPGAKNEPISLGRGAIREVGFGQDEAMLPYSPQSFAGYRLLSEYFTFPRKFLFFDIVLPAGALKNAANRLELNLYLNRTHPDLERSASAETFRLGCTPIVNLFSKQADPAKVDQTSTEYRIEPDHRNPLGYEIYSVDRVEIASNVSQRTECRPFYSLVRRIGSQEQDVFWYPRRRAPREPVVQTDRGSDVYLTLVDLDFNRLPADDRTLQVKATCMNRDLPQELPRGGGQPQLKLAIGGPVTLECLSHPTPTIRKSLERGAMWRLISQLNLNYLSLAGGERAAETLREMLRLYNFAESLDVEAKISGILDIKSRLVTRRAGGVSAGGVARGLELTLRFDEERFADHGLYLFATVLERFLALYCSINSFTQLVATTKQRDGVLKRWPPRAGEQVLL